jgi:hypothetical protein
MDSEKKRVDPRDISVVVQGPIMGSPNDQEKDRHTYLSLKSIRKVLPGAKIILSTWEGSDVEGLDYDELVESRDPGISAICDAPNCFRQIVSSINGLRKCTTKYAIKARSDILFKSDAFLKYFVEFNELPFDEHYKILKQRIVVKSHTSPREITRPFHVNDWFYFGLAEDLRNIFDIPLDHQTWLSPDNNISNGALAAEQYIWLSFLGKYRQIPCERMDDISHDNATTSERYLANNCILLSGKKLGIYSLKFPHVGQSWRFTTYVGLYTFNEYKKILNKYAGSNLMIVPNPIERAVCFVFGDARYFFRKRMPKFYRFVADRVVKAGKRN